jgi:uncharacterized membrane protein YfcA
MPDLAGLPPEGVGWIVIAAFVGGLVRGFSGFGTAMVFLPVAAPFLGPFGALLALTFMDLLGPLPNLRKAWAEVAKGDLLRLGIGCAATLPLGLWILTQVAPEVFRYVVSGASLLMVAILLLGLRYQGQVSRTMVTGIGATAGLLGGIAFYMSRPLPIAVIRATILLFLFVFDVLIIGTLAGFGRVTLIGAIFGLCLAIPNAAGNWLGGRMFRPERERMYRLTAYTLIAGVALSGLPLWG